MITVFKRILFLIFSFPVLTYLVTLTFAVDPFFQSRCVEDTGNYTANSAYERDLNSLFNEISSTTKLNYGFFHSKFGEVNGIALCRGDVKLDDCTSCLNGTVSEMKQRCHRYKEAIGWSEFCMLRYSSRNISKRLEISPGACLLNTRSAVQGNPEEILRVLQVLLDYLRRVAAARGALLKYATGNSSLGAQIWYALVQCTPDLSEQDCNDCLEAATEGIRSCCFGQMGCRILRPSCNLRFESAKFFDAAPAVPPPQSPQSKKGRQSTCFFNSGSGFPKKINKKNQSGFRLVRVYQRLLGWLSFLHVVSSYGGGETFKRITKIVKKFNYLTWYKEVYSMSTQAKLLTEKMCRDLKNFLRFNWIFYMLQQITFVMKISSERVDLALYTR
ncbi:hypothetical protein SCA6_020333 [Theobroma cacao]